MAKEWRKHSSTRDNSAFQNIWFCACAPRIFPSSNGYPRCLQDRILCDFEFCFENKVNIVSKFGNAFVVHIEMCFHKLTSCVASLPVWKCVVDIEMCFGNRWVVLRVWKCVVDIEMCFLIWIVLWHLWATVQKHKKHRYSLSQFHCLKRYMHAELDVLNEDLGP